MKYAIGDIVMYRRDLVGGSRRTRVLWLKQNGFPQIVIDVDRNGFPAIDGIREVEEDWHITPLMDSEIQ